jgi:hypothetical protein
VVDRLGGVHSTMHKHKASLRISCSLNSERSAMDRQWYYLDSNGAHRGPASADPLTGACGALGPALG